MDLFGNVKPKKFIKKFSIKSPFFIKKLTISSILRMLRTHSAACLMAKELTSKGCTTFSSRMLVTVPW